MWFPLSSPPSSSSSTEIQQEVEKTETQILPELVGGGVGGVVYNGGFQLNLTPRPRLQPPRP